MRYLEEVRTAAVRVPSFNVLFVIFVIFVVVVIAEIATSMLRSRLI